MKGPERGVLFLNGPPPRLIVAVPRHGAAETLLELHLGGPAQPAQLCRVQRVTAIVAESIGDRTDERRRTSSQFQNTVGEVDVLDFVAAADVVDLAILAAID